MAGLSARHLQAIHSLLRSRRHRVPLNATWQFIREELEVGEPRGNSLYFDDAMLRVLRRAAECASGAANLLASAPRGNRLQVAAQGFIDEKTARQRPDDGFVLLKGRLPAPLPTLSPSLSLRVPLESLDLSAVVQVLVIENLDSFDDWEGYRAPAGLADSLILYRGHGGLARGARRLLGALPAAVRVGVFADYDPAGLCIATGLPRADFLLLPEPAPRLLDKGNREDYADQFRQAAHLERIELDGWQGVWEEMKEHGVSIKQQHMLALGVALRQIPRRRSDGTRPW
ncbi:DUF7281 domain-containing protein [Azotobacter vinelandii]|uniref:DUF7281 domain-containing protein n=1 Tax=Azotobacter vinelandii TaxID=354 RepID=UPI000AAFEAFB|nr:hypothetical protein [Azotobacter vinelandii]